MSDFQQSSFIDLSRHFLERGIKPLRLRWYADLRETQQEILSPSRFADFRFFRAPVSIPFAAQAPIVVVPAVIDIPVAIEAPKVIDLATITSFTRKREVMSDDFNEISLPIQAALAAAKLVAFVEAQQAMLAAAPAPVAAPAIVVEQPRKTLSLKTSVDIAAKAIEKIYTDYEKPAPIAVAAKPRKTLSLKTKVELPPIDTLSRRSTGVDLNVAFKTEMRMVTDIIADVSGVVHPEDIMAEKRKSPVSSKTWADVLMEAEAYKPSVPKSFDLAGAFKREMQALEAQEKKAAPAANSDIQQKQKTFAA